MGGEREDGAVLGVSVPEGLTGSTFLHGILREAAARFPGPLGDANIPNAPSAFKRSYTDILVRFEALRVASPERSEIARFIVDRTQSQLRFAGEDFDGPLAEYLSSPGEASTLEEHTLAGPGRLQPSVRFGEQHYSGAEVADLADDLLQQSQLTRAAAGALEWIARRAVDERGLDLSGERFVVLGAGAEIAPTPLLLAAGARVLWIDVGDPAPLLERGAELGGTLVTAPGARDLLAQPREIAATIARFAEGHPVHLGLYAYAPGESREWRLAAAMNAIVRSLDPALVGSVSLYVSPTSPAVVQPEDVAAARARARQVPGWQAALAGVGLLDRDAPYERNGVCIARTLVPLQGLSYQGAQYVSKLLMAETCATRGSSPRPDAPRRAVTVSANVAPITRTRSMQHPVFQAAFLGASHFGVHTFEPETTRGLSGLLVLHDLLNPDAPGSAAYAPADDPKRAADLFSQQIHGGLYAAPWALDSALRPAAALGLLRRPGLIRGLF